MAAEDAIVARDHGVDGIIVSNHGGRQLDGTAAPLRVLPRIVEAVGSDIAVMIDGGIRRGTDVLKALALGADFVFVGRPFNYPLRWPARRASFHRRASVTRCLRRWPRRFSVCPMRSSAC